MSFCSSVSRKSIGSASRGLTGQILQTFGTDLLRRGEFGACGPINEGAKHARSETRRPAGRLGNVPSSNRTFAVSGRHDHRSLRRASDLVAGRTLDFLLSFLYAFSWGRPAQFVSGVMSRAKSGFGPPGRGGASSPRSA